MSSRGVALLAVLFALTLLALLALPFAVSMGVGADAAARDVERVQVEQAAASARDLLLADAAMSHPTFDTTPTYDSLAEYPDGVTLPEKFQDLHDEGRLLLGGSVQDVQRKLGLDSASPLVLTNLLGNTTRLNTDLAPDAAMMAVEDATKLPEAGFVWLAGEVIRYTGKQGNNLLDLQRGMFPELGFVKATDPVAETALVLDYRCVLAAAWPFFGRSTGRGAPDRRSRRPFAAPSELAEIEAAGAGAFTQDELDLFEESLSPWTMASTAATWGRPERVFDELEPGARSMRVKSALHVGAGSTVRLRDTKTGVVEYGLVMSTSNEQFTKDLLLPSVFHLNLLFPVTQAFHAIDTVVEPLVPAPVNVNTASMPVLEALFREVRRAPNVKVHESDGRKRETPLPGISRSDARALAEEIAAAQVGPEMPPGPSQGQGPFRGWQDFAERLWKPRFDAAPGMNGKLPWIYLYRNLRTGRDSVLEMGTAPIVFTSGPWVEYRAAGSYSRSTVAPGVAAREEITGIAAAVPGFELEHEWSTQELLEDAFQLDRRAPFWVTTPINLGALQVDNRGGGDQGNDPAARYFPNVVPMALPDMGFGAPRFASQDPADAGMTPATAIAVPRPWSRGSVFGHDSFAQTIDPRGRDVTKEGAYQMVNVGPRGGTNGAPKPQARHDRISFPFSNQYGFMGRFGTSFWLQPQTLNAVTLFDHGIGDDERNRMVVLARDGNLVFEVLDEAGLDPNPSDSPAGVDRTATQWTLPLADLALPADTPVHLSVSAYGSRPSDLSFAVDGMPRGKPKYLTYLAAPIDVFDPTLGNNNNVLPPVAGNERYLDITVESTEGFPPQGVLRIGTELFEYSSIRGNTFQCQWKDSLGGRAARQSGFEFAPAIPVDPNGKPTVDIEELQRQGVNIEVFPDHPVGSPVQLYGYATLLPEDTAMMVGTTTLSGSLGGWAVARGFIQNPRPISIAPLNRPPLPIGEGIDENWSGDLQLADPVPTGTTQPGAAQAAITDAFPSGGGFALLVQTGFNLQLDELGNLSTSVAVGGVELVRYGARQGNKLTSVQRAQTIPGDDARIDRAQYDGTAHKFVTKWVDWLETSARVKFNDEPTTILWVVPVSIAVDSTNTLWDPASRQGRLEWVQLYPKGDVNDTEWVRYDAMVGNHLVRGNRAAWDRVRYALTAARGRINGSITRTGGTTGASIAVSSATWGTVTPTSGYIGYVPKVESDFPQIAAARRSLAFRGDPFTRTSSHPHTNSIVMQCQRLELDVGNYGAFTGRTGRNDRVALVQGSIADGTTRPVPEWHTVNWSCRRYSADNLQQDKNPAEHYGPWPFQLVAFTDGVKGRFEGTPRDQAILESRRYDRVVKFPSGELPAAYCENVTIGGGVGNQANMRGFVDEVDVVQHEANDLIVDEPFDANAKVFRVNPHVTYSSVGPIYSQNDLSAAYPAGGGLLWVDGEIIAYQSRSNGEFTVATNGRGLLDTQARGHDRGDCVRFLTHRPAAILSGGVGARDDVLQVQALAAMPVAGTALLGRELLHYAWSRQSGDQGSLEMPRWYQPGDDGTSSSSHGLLRGRFGTSPNGASSGEVVIAWPCRYWDRYVESSDDPELAYFQLTTTEAPSYYRSILWHEETQDARVQVVCLVRTDSKAPWTADPKATPGLWQFQRNAGDDQPKAIGAQASRLEVRFATIYKPGVFNLENVKEHAWKTSVKVDRVRVQYEGQGSVLDEKVTAR